MPRIDEDSLPIESKMAICIEKKTSNETIFICCLNRNGSQVGSRSSRSQQSRAIQACPWLCQSCPNTISPPSTVTPKQRKIDWNWTWKPKSSRLTYPPFTNFWQSPYKSRSLFGDASQNQVYHTTWKVPMGDHPFNIKFQQLITQETDWVSLK